MADQNLQDLVTNQQNAVVVLGKIADVLAKMSLIAFVTPPATATSAGVAGQVSYDASFFYVCVAPSTWRRVAIAAW